MIHDLITLLSGGVIGLALGLTGGGGSIFAVPLLIYVLGTDVRSAVGVSLAAVGTTSAFGVLTNLRKREVNFRVGLMFALSGMAGAPVGTWIGGKLPDALILGVFASMMLLVGLKMWRGARVPGRAVNASELPGNPPASSRARLVKLLLVGVLVGVFSGIFGVGGGFIIVPALVLFGGIAIHEAVSTSLLVITMICASGVASFLLGGEGMPVHLTLVFVAGGCLGMFGGSFWRSRLSTQMLRQVFAAAMWFIAVFVLVRTFV